MISIIVPVYNEEKTLAETIRRLRALPGEKEIIVADGGSTDATRTIAEEEGVFLPTGKGRARQMNEGARAAKGDIFWFVHADSLVSPGSIPAMEKAVEKGAIGGGFSLYFYDSRHFHLWWIAHTSNWRARFLRLIFGDQGLFLTRDAFRQLNGYKEMALMEDWDLSVRAHKLGKMRMVKEPIGTSARRFQEGGILRTLWQMHKIKIGYMRGIPPEKLAEQYKEIR